MEKREGYLDISKGIGIILIILGHCEFYQNIKYLWTFHIAIFFIISGITLNVKKKNKEFIIGKIKRLLVPYWIFNILVYLTLEILYKVIKNTNYMSIKKFFEVTVKGVYYGNNHKDISIINTPTWFLVTLFCSITIYFFLVKIVRNKKIIFFIALIVSIIGISISKRVSIRLFFGLDISAVVIILICIGNIFKDYLIAMAEYLSNNIIRYILSCLILIGCLVAFYKPIYISLNIYTSFINFIICSISGFILVLINSLVIERRVNSKINKMLKYIGINSLWFMCLDPIRAIIKVFLEKLGVLMGIYSKFLVGSIQFILTILIIFIFINSKDKYIKRFFEKKIDEESEQKC